MPSVAERITKARTKLLLNQPFFGTLALRLRMVEVPHGFMGVTTMGTDGTHIFYSAKFVESISDDEVQGVIAHEVLHPALQHLHRLGDRDHEIFNMSADYAINPLIIDAGLKLPSIALIDRERFTDKCTQGPMSAEEIYRLIYAEETKKRQQMMDALKKALQGAGKGSGSGNTDGSGMESNQGGKAGNGTLGPQKPMPETEGGFGQFIKPVVVDPKTGQIRPASPAEAAQQADEWRIATEQSARQAKLCGKLPGSLEREIGETKQEVVNWRETLRRFITQAIPHDYSWSRPNRRYVAAGLYLPGTIKEGLGEIVIAVDTSGSIGGDELSMFSAEINAIVNECRPERVHVVYCDAAIAHVDEYQSDEPVELSPHGGGGTDFRPPFAWVDEQGLEPKCLVYLTDLCCDSYPTAPSYPVLWASTSRHYNPPWGEVISLLE